MEGLKEHLRTLDYLSNEIAAEMEQIVRALRDNWDEVARPEFCCDVLERWFSIVGQTRVEGVQGSCVQRVRFIEEDREPLAIVPSQGGLVFAIPSSWKKLTTEALLRECLDCRAQSYHRRNLYKPVSNGWLRWRLLTDMIEREEVILTKTNTLVRAGLSTDFLAEVRMLAGSL